MNDFSYDCDNEMLIDNEILMQCDRRQSPELTNDIEELDFDDRVHYFKTLNDSVLFNNEDMTLNDLKVWFPECGEVTEIDKNKRTLSRDAVQLDLECIIAEMMEEEGWGD